MTEHTITVTPIVTAEEHNSDYWMDRVKIYCKVELREALDTLCFHSTGRFYVKIKLRPDIVAEAFYTDNTFIRWLERWNGLFDTEAEANYFIHIKSIDDFADPLGGQFKAETRPIPNVPKFTGGWSKVTGVKDLVGAEEQKMRVMTSDLRTLGHSIMHYLRGDLGDVEWFS